MGEIPVNDSEAKGRHVAAVTEEVPGDVIPVLARRIVYISSVVVNALAVTLWGLDVISADQITAVLAGLGILTGGLAVGYTPRNK